MPSTRESNLWSIARRAAWPKAPSWMSFSTLSELETCPRRWALNHAYYPNVWDGRGYPQPLRFALLEGRIVHLSLQRIIQALVERGCKSLFDETAISAMRELGGFTQTVAGSLETVLKSFETNPRTTLVLEEIRHNFTARIPHIRTEVQKLLSRVQFNERSVARASKSVRSVKGISRPYLSRGSYSEVEIRADELHWRGFADLITLYSSTCEIRDFKTGEPKPEHEFQLRVYAALWALDRELNPTGRLANRLVLSYDTGDLEVSVPSDEEVRSIEDDLRLRSQKAIAKLGSSPPQANVSQENCGYCPVRQLCDEYWRWMSCMMPRCKQANGEFCDVQAKLLNQHGPSSWNTRVEVGGFLQVNEPMLLRIRNVPFELQAGQRVRLLNVHIKVLDENLTNERRQLVATMSKTSEVFLMA